MGDSRVEKFDTVALTKNGSPADVPATKADSSGLSRLAQSPLIRPLNRVARGILDAVNCSLDAVRGRYDR
jgi:hypothetical protein